jgi:cyclopropane fatty-acyl-phospholipid synthase-like methyltransferase
MSFYSAFAEDYERVFPFREEVYRFLRANAGDPGGRVLDVGCGPGHYCGRFVTDGYSATGIDMDSSMIAEATRRHPEATFFCLDMRAADSVGSGFRSIYSIGNVLAHLRQEELSLFTAKVYSMLEPGGCWIIQVMNWDAFGLLNEYEFPEKTIGSAGRVETFHRHYVFNGPDSVTFSISLRQAGNVLFEEQTMLYPASTEWYLRLHESAGFRCTGVQADFIGSPLRSDPGTGLVMSFRRE